MTKRSCVSVPPVVIVVTSFSRRVSVVNRAKLETIGNQWSLTLVVVMVCGYRLHPGSVRVAVAVCASRGVGRRRHSRQRCL